MLAVVGGCNWFGGGGGIAEMTFGVFLNNALDKVNVAIDKAREGGRLLELQAGNELALALENMRTTYDDSLDKTISSVDAKVKDDIEKIALLASQLENKAANDLKDAIAQGQQIANTLPLVDKHPQVRKISPHYFTPGNILLHVAGNFPQLSEPDYKPYLEIGTAKVYGEEATQDLAFHFSFGLPEQDKLQYSRVKLVVPFKSGALSSKKNGEFHLLLGQLPKSPGTIKITSKHEKDQVERQHIATQTWQQHSSNDDHKDIIHTSPTYSGWKVLPDTVKFVVEWSQGDENDQWSKRLVSTDAGRVIYSVTTIYHRIGTSGKVNFHFEFDIERHQTVSEYVTEDVELRWGQSRTFPYPAGTWKVVYQPFQGESQEFAGASNANKFLTVSTEGNELKLLATPPGELEL